MCWRSQGRSPPRRGNYSSPSPLRSLFIQRNGSRRLSPTSSIVCPPLKETRGCGLLISWCFVCKTYQYGTCPVAVSHANSSAALTRSFTRPPRSCTSESKEAKGSFPRLVTIVQSFTTRVSSMFPEAYSLGGFPFKHPRSSIINHFWGHLKILFVHVSAELCIS